MSKLRMTSASHYTPQLLLAIILCFASGAAPACTRTGGRNYFPLTDGAQWKYAGHFLSSTGEKYPVRATIHVEGTTLIRGQRYYKHVTTSDFKDFPNAPGTQEQVRYYRVESTGTYFLPGNDLDGAERLAMPSPVPVGERWLSGSVEVTAERVGRIEVGGHKYEDCLKLTYMQPGGPRSNEEYYAPGVGLIKFVYINTTPPQSTVVLTLETYRL
ncbi:MAG: hypothetical protein QOH49_2802 [Acidobacteriota bacterium]|jgi:hypothetical protein|nr:hypothetical protein [Acidobacteriota bacterium]